MPQNSSGADDFMATEVQIDGKRIGPGQPIYLIAELGGNFSDLPTARKLIDLAVKTGVDALKFQHYRADTLASTKAKFEMENTGNVSQHDLFKKYELDETLTANLFAYCREKKITALTTPSHRTD